MGAARDGAQARPVLTRRRLGALRVQRRQCLAARHDFLFTRMSQYRGKPAPCRHTVPMLRLTCIQAAVDLVEDHGRLAAKAPCQLVQATWRVLGPARLGPLQQPVPCSRRIVGLERLFDLRQRRRRLRGSRRLRCHGARRWMTPSPPHQQRHQPRQPQQAGEPRPQPGDHRALANGWRRRYRDVVIAVGSRWRSCRRLWHCIECHGRGR